MTNLNAAGFGCQSWCDAKADVEYGTQALVFGGEYFLPDERKDWKERLLTIVLVTCSILSPQTHISMSANCLSQNQMQNSCHSAFRVGTGGESKRQK